MTEIPPRQSPPAQPAQQTAGGGKLDDKPSQLQPLIAIGTAVTTLAAVLGTLAFSGLLARLPRNEPELTTGAFALVILAAAAWTAATLFRSDAKVPKPVTWLLVAGIAVFSAGLILAVFGVFKTYSQDEKPRIHVRFDQEKGLSTDVKVSALASDKEISVRVHAWRRAQDSADEWEPFELYNAAVGPDANGEVDHSIELPIAYGTYEIVTVSAQTGRFEQIEEATSKETGPPCPVGKRVIATDGFRAGGFKQKPKKGCLIFTLPRFARVPALKASLGREGESVALSLSSENTPYRALLLVTSRVEGRWTLLRRELVIPDGSGVIAADRDVGIPSSATKVCVLATWYRSGEDLPPPRCPAATSNETVWTVITLQH